MARLDKDAPFEIVGGLPGAAYMQNGRYFNNGGLEVETYQVGEGDDQRTLARIKVTANQNLTVADEEELADRAVAEKAQDPASLHWQHLKTMVENFGHEWKGRKEALAWLEGQKADEEQAA